MRLVINKGVREALVELEAAFDKVDASTRILSNPNGDFAQASAVGFDKMEQERAVLTAAARLLSHATRGKRYPNMTGRFYGRRGL